MKLISNLKSENNSLLEKLNAANERILQLTQKVKKSGYELTGGDETNRSEGIKKTSKQVSNGNDQDLVNTDYEVSESKMNMDPNSQGEDKVNLYLNF
jgi:hypothetical protein